MANWYVSSTKYALVAQWQASHAYSIGAIVRQLATPTAGNERCFTCVTAGTSSSTEPNWSTSNIPNGNTVTDGTVTWRAITGVSYYNGDTAGNNWAAPYARLSSILTSTTATGYNPTSGDNIFVDSTHNESASISQIINIASYSPPINVWTVSNATVPPTSVTTGSSVTVTGSGNTLSFGEGYISQAADYYGISFTSSSSSNGFVFLNQVSSYIGVNFSYCSFNASTTTVGAIYSFGATFTSSYLKFNTCTFLFGSTSQYFNESNPFYMTVEMINCTFASSGVVPSTLFYGNIPTITIRDSNLSAITTTLYTFSTSSEGGVISFQNCTLGAGVTPYTGTPDGPAAPRLQLFNCDSATTNYRYYLRAWGGSTQSNTSNVRTGGASDGTTPISWQITTDNNACLYAPFQCDDISIWNNLVGASHTATIYLNSSSTLTNAQFWVEFEYPSSASAPLGANISNKVVRLATPTALTTDTSTWSSAATNKYSVSVSFTPQAKGIVKAKIFVGISNATIYVDPLIVIV